ncbi:hypothetical protein DL93DRAFT_2081664 [Clavulina sp. PMI_390]|nr:hypothetical protein DL93DRAFT_2081664 [Clavulina sp. PMI_390]
MPIRKHRCPVCGQKFARPSSVVQARLISSHLPPLDFPCVAVGCDRLFTTSSNAKRHHRNVHRENRKLVASEPPAPAIPTPTHIPPQDPSATSQEELPMAPMTHEGFQEPWFAATEIVSDEIIG